ncbi:MAG: hypothetical protein R3C26_02330 [Calditrichia bacterium]
MGELGGKVWRVGLIMGYNSRPENVMMLLSALENCVGKVSKCRKINYLWGGHFVRPFFVFTEKDSSQKD